MMFGQKKTPRNFSDQLAGWSIEVMPRTAAKVGDFRSILPPMTRVYIAHIEGTPIAEMVETASRLARDGFQVMPHFPARLIADRAMLQDWIDRYQGEANVTQALVLAGGVAKPVGEFDSSMALLQTDAFAKAGFTRLHVAGHPEGNRDIDPTGGHSVTDAALLWKQDYSRQTGIEMAIATQFVFEAPPVLDWIARLRRLGVELPVHVGVAGPAKLQTLIKFAIACGVGPSLSVLQKRAKDVTKLLLPFEPTDLIAALAKAQEMRPQDCPEQVHFFPLGGIQTCADWVRQASESPNLRAIG